MKNNNKGNKSSKDNKGKSTKQNRSMFLYTALIFVVALLLIILAFFGQTNLSHLRKTEDERSEVMPTETITADAAATAAPSAPNATGEPDPEMVAKMANTISSLDTENKRLHVEIDLYNSLVEAQIYVSQGNKTEAKAILDTINIDDLTDNQRTFYGQIKSAAEEGE